jgi:hypothetical protein
MLGGQDAVDGLQRKLPPVVQKVGKMRLSKAGLTRQQRDTERAPLYPAQQFQAESFVHLGEIHLWKIRHQQWERMVFVCPWKTYLC